jgi:FkbM family methyltransferase
MLGHVRSALKAYVSARVGSPDMTASLQRLSDNGFKPEHIFDVGAYQGDFTKMCLEVWPATRVTAFEVLERRVEDLRRLNASGVPVEVFGCLVGAENREAVPFHEMETASSVLREHVHKLAATKQYPMRTVDTVVHEHCTGWPDLLKLDVQGYELEVLKGAERTLDHVSVVLAEVNLLDIHVGVPLLADVIAWLDQRGWVAYDICGITRRPFDTALWQADFIFVQRSSPLRSDKRWS